jgi:hypothetical protein
MIPPVMSLAIQIHSGKFYGLHLPHGIKLQISVQFLYPCLGCHLGRTIKVWDFYLPCSSFKLRTAPVVWPGLVSELELVILIQGHLPLNDHIQAIVIPSTLCHLLNKVIYLFLLYLFICECGKERSRVHPAPHLSM